MMTGLKIFLMLVFFIGTQGEANPMDRCLNKVRLSHILQSSFDLKKADEHELNAFCSIMGDFLECINDVLVAEIGETLEEAAQQLNDEGYPILLNMKNLFHNLCTEGSQFRADFFATSDCFRTIDDQVISQCEDQAKDVYDKFRELQPGSVGDPLAEDCIVSTFQIGCLAAATKEECGDEGFAFSKNLVGRLGIVKSAECSADLLNTMKTTLLDSLEMSDTRKGIYRLIMDLKKRRK